MELIICTKDLIRRITRVIIRMVAFFAWLSDNLILLCCELKPANNDDNCKIVCMGTITASWCINKCICLSKKSHLSALWISLTSLNSQYTENAFSVTYFTHYQGLTRATLLVLENKRLLRIQVNRKQVQNTRSDTVCDCKCMLM